MCEYHEISYWSQRYDADSEPFEWYTSFTPLRSFVSNVVYNNPLATTPTPPTSIHHASSSHRKQPSLNRHRSLTMTSATLEDEEEIINDPIVIARPRNRSSSVIETIRAVSREGERKLQVLEIGCGSSEVAIDIVKMCGSRVQVVAIDFAPSAIEEMKKKYSSIKGIICQSNKNERTKFFGNEN